MTYLNRHRATLCEWVGKALLGWHFELVISLTALPHNGLKGCDRKDGTEVYFDAMVVRWTKKPSFYNPKSNVKLDLGLMPLLKTEWVRALAR